MREDFLWYISPHLWTSLVADTNSSATVKTGTGGVGGILDLQTGDATDNNEAAVATTNGLITLAADRPFYAEARLQFTQNTNNATNVAFGLAENMGSANLLSDNGAGTSITNTGVLVYCIDSSGSGGGVWRAGSACGSSTADTASVQTAGGTAYQTVGIAGRAVDATNYEFTFFVDGKPLTDSNNKPIKHQIAYSGATLMKLGLYTKTGAAATQHLLADYVYLAARRNLAAAGA